MTEPNDRSPGGARLSCWSHEGTTTAEHAGRATRRALGTLDGSRRLPRLARPGSFDNCPGQLTAAWRDAITRTQWLPRRRVAPSAYSAVAVSGESATLGGHSISVIGFIRLGSNSRWVTP